MNKVLAAERAYSSNSRQIKGLREQEYDVILDVTRQLKRIQVQAKPKFSDLIAVLYNNERLWNTIAVQVADAQNELPALLRARLFYMAQFVAQQSDKVRNSEADISSLVDVNVSVLRGLKGRT